jgi:hypothetical protein
MAYRAKFIPRDTLDKLRDSRYGDAFDVLAKELDLAFANFKQTEEFKSLGLCRCTNQGLHRALPGKDLCRMHGGRAPKPERNARMNIRDFTDSERARYKPLPRHIREQLQRLYGGGTELYFTIMVVAQ